MKAEEEEQKKQEESKGKQENDEYELTVEKLPNAYIDKYKDPETFNAEYLKYVSHIN